MWAFRRAFGADPYREHVTVLRELITVRQTLGRSLLGMVAADASMFAGGR